jgi:hypothetical protein
MWRNASRAERLVASEGETCFMELVLYRLRA